MPYDKDLHIFVTPELHRAVFDAARRADLTPSQWIRRAISEKLERDQPS